MGSRSPRVIACAAAPSYVQDSHGAVAPHRCLGREGSTLCGQNIPATHKTPLDINPGILPSTVQTRKAKERPPSFPMGDFAELLVPATGAHKTGSELVLLR